MGVTTDILTAFCSRLSTLPDAPLIIYPGTDGRTPTTVPDTAYAPPAVGIWLEARLFPGEPADIAWGINSCHDMIGFAQVLVMYRPGLGQVRASTVADRIIQHFPKGLLMGPVHVRKRAWQSPAISDDDKEYIPVTISYRGVN